MNALQSHETRPTAVVLNMYSTGLGIARDLGRYGIPVVGLSSRRDAPGHFSRYCRGLISPDSLEEPERLRDFLIHLGRAQSRRGILFPTRDADVLFIAKYREDLEPFFVIPQPGHDVLDSILNKDHLAQVAESVGVETPRTLRISSVADLEKKREGLTFPLVVKPVYAYHWRLPKVWEAVGKRKGMKVNTFPELLAVYRRISPYQEEVLVQEWVHGSEDQYFILGAYFTSHSECLGAFTAQKIRQFPPDFGLGCLVRSVHNPEVLSLGTRLLGAIRFTGIAEVEFKRDSQTGSYRLIEINPRHWDQHTLGSACGVNLTYLAYRDLCEEADPSPLVQESGRRYWIGGGGLIGRLKEDLRKGQVDLSTVVPFLPVGKKVYAVWSMRDPLPFWTVVTRRRGSGREGRGRASGEGLRCRGDEGDRAVQSTEVRNPGDGI